MLQRNDRNLKFGPAFTRKYNMPTIHNLTVKQVEMLDIMWSLDTTEEYFDWYDNLSKEDQDMADTLQRMVILSELDEVAILGDMQEAKELLSKFAL